MLFLRMLNLILTRYFVFQQRCFDFMYHSGKKDFKNFLHLVFLVFLLPCIVLFSVLIYCFQTGANYELTYRGQDVCKGVFNQRKLMFAIDLLLHIQ